MSTDVVPAAPTDEEAGATVDVGELLHAMAAAARNNDEPILLAAGTFAAYPTPNGGLHLVMTVEQGPFAQPGPHRANLPANLLRAVIALAGGSKGGAVKALFSRGK